MKHIRLPAEFEQQSMIQFTWPHSQSDWAPYLDEANDFFVRFAVAVASTQKLLIVSPECESVAALLSHANAPMKHIFFAQIDSNDTWARDHGGITVYQDGKPLILDFIFNGWGLKFAADKDNLITQSLFHLGYYTKSRLKSIPFVLEGGSIETDGQGTILTTSRCLLSPNRNKGLSKRKIEQKLQKYLGAKRIIWLEHGDIAGDDTDGHIDTLARFCDEETICYVSSDDVHDENYAELKKMEAELASLKTDKNKPYKLIKLPMPSAVYGDDGHRLPATYANFLITNDSVIVPTYNDAKDSEAVEILRTAFNKKTIIPLDARTLIKWHGSVHCACMHYPKGVI